MGTRAAAHTVAKTLPIYQSACFLWGFGSLGLPVWLVHLPNLAGLSA